MKQSPTRVFLIILFVFLGCFGVAYAAAGMLTALPTPAVGGTCGPSTGSETAAEALVEPGSIGAGPKPPRSNATGYHQWVTFVQQCQDLADRRGLASAAIFVISVVVSGAGLYWVLRRREDDDPDDPDDGLDAGSSTYPPSGIHDPAALVGAGAVVGTTAPAATWSPAPAPGYGPAPGYPTPPGYPESAYPPPAYPAYPAYPEGYPAPPSPYPPQPGYPQAPGYPQQSYPPPAVPAPPAYPAAAHPVPPTAAPPPAPPAPPVDTTPPPDAGEAAPDHGA